MINIFWNMLLFCGIVALGALLVTIVATAIWIIMDMFDE